MTEPIRAESLLGAWELVSYELRGADDEVLGHPLGADATGIIMYTADGYMSAQLMRGGRAPFDQPEPDGGTTDQTTAAARGYLAYSGPYELDEPSSTFFHHVEVSLLPNWVGRPQIRHGRIEGGTLILAADVVHHGQTARATLTWRRPQR